MSAAWIKAIATGTFIGVTIMGALGCTGDGQLLGALIGVALVSVSVA